MTTEIIKKLKPAKYKYVKGAPLEHQDKIYMGFMAQHLRELFGEDHSIVRENPDNGFLMVDSVQLIAPLVKCVQELTEKVEKLENQLKEKRMN